VAYLPGLLQSDFIAEVYWTLCLEIQFYLVFALMMMLVTRLTEHMEKERALDFVLWPCALFANLWALQVAPFQLPGLFVSHWYMFLAGVLVWRAAHGASKGDYIPTLAAGLELAMLGGATLHFQSIPLAVGTLTGAVVLLGGLLGKLHSWLSARPFQLLGGISYSLYLVHNSLTGAGFRVGYMITGRGTPRLEGFWLLVVVSGCVLGAWLFHRAIEAPTMALAKRIGSPRRRRSLEHLAEPAHAEPRKSVA
jgi:peptidoglycan/LPS O-acetylase OafA/YrhL